MSRPSSAPRTSDEQAAVAVTGLRWLSGVAAFGLALSALYAATGRGLPCPFRLLTGWQCPLCGSTHLGADLLHGDVVAAFAENPVVFVALVLATIVGVAWLIEWAGGPRWRPPARLTTRLSAVHPTRWLVIGVVGATLYTLARHAL